MTVRKMNQAEYRRRVKQAEYVHIAAQTLRMYGRPELADEISVLAAQIRDGELHTAPEDHR